MMMGTNAPKLDFLQKIPQINDIKDRYLFASRRMYISVGSATVRHQCLTDENSPVVGMTSSSRRQESFNGTCIYLFAPYRSLHVPSEPAHEECTVRSLQIDTVRHQCLMFCRSTTFPYTRRLVFDSEDVHSACLEHPRNL